jgi:hypothetical protein
VSFNLDPTQALLPSPEVYEDEYRCWPWGKIIDAVAEWVCAHAGQSTLVIDYMCGTGFLLDLIHQRRPDLRLVGCSLNRPYIDYAKRRYPYIEIYLHDCLTYKPVETPAMILCTAGLHHIERRFHADFISKIANELSAGSSFLLAEEAIRPFKSTMERRMAVLELWTELISFCLTRTPSIEVIEAATTAFVNDLFERGEYKLTCDEIKTLLQNHFAIQSMIKTWPQGDVQFGDFLFICTKL